MKILVTGAAGFLGSLLAEELSIAHEVVGLDNMSAGDHRNVPDSISFATVDCREDISSLLRNVDIVFHCAAHPHEGLSVFSPSTICSSIFEASVSVFSQAIAAGARRIVYFSSMARYGAQTPPFTEEHVPSPRDPYGIAKVAAEDVLRVLCNTHGVEYTIVVPHNIIGAHQKYDDPFRNVAAIMANRLLLGMRPIVYGTGLQTRCFSDVRDILPVLLSVATHPLSGQIYNVGPDEEVVTIEHMGRMLAEIIGAPWEPIRLPARPLEVAHAHCSSAKIRKWFDYTTRYSLQETLESLVLYIRHRRPKPFDYYLPLEIVNDKTPKFWTGEVK
jgi:UDP-glucose 4-epimerase